MIIWISHLLHIGSGPSRCHLAEATTDQPWERKVENQAMLLWVRWKTGLVKDKRSECWWLPWSKLWSLVLSRGPNIFLLLWGREPSLTAHSSFFLVSQPPHQQKSFFSWITRHFLMSSSRGAFFTFCGSFSSSSSREALLFGEEVEAPQKAHCSPSHKNDDARVLVFHFNFSVELLGTIFYCLPQEVLSSSSIFVPC